jgi:signal recognition particle subunit SRP72
MSPEDKVAEILPICVQQVYVALQRGELDHARSLAEEISVDEYGTRCL